MTIKGLLLRFALGYFALELLVGLILSSMGVGTGTWTTWINIGIIMGLTNWLCISFGKKNARYFTRLEKNLTVLGMAVIDIILQLLFLLVSFGITNPIKGSSIIISISLVLLLHVPFIYWAIRMCKAYLIDKRVIYG